MKDDTKPVTVAVVSAPEKSKPDEKPSATIKADAIITGKDVPKNYIIKRLRDFDPNLFNYKTQGKLFSSYSRVCPKQNERQPIAVSKEQVEK